MLARGPGKWELSVPWETMARWTPQGRPSTSWGSAPTAGAASRTTGAPAVRDAEVLLGGPRQLALLPAGTPGRRGPWPSPCFPPCTGLLTEHAGRRVCVLASGDPMFHGIGATLARLLGPDAAAVVPHPSSVSLACARLGWPGRTPRCQRLLGRRPRSRGELAPGAPAAGPQCTARRPARSPCARDAGYGGAGDDGAGRARRSRARKRRRARRGDGRTRRRPVERRRGRVRRGPGAPVRWRRCPACPTTRSTTTGSSPSATCAPPPSPASRRVPASCCGTSERARAWASSGCARTARAGRSPWSATRRGRRDRGQRRRARRPRAAGRRGTAPEVLTGLPPRTPSSSAAASASRAFSRRPGTALRPGGRIVVHAVTRVGVGARGGTTGRRRADPGRGGARRAARRRSRCGARACRFNGVREAGGGQA